MVHIKWMDPVPVGGQSVIGRTATRGLEDRVEAEAGPTLGEPSTTPISAAGSSGSCPSPNSNRHNYGDQRSGRGGYGPFQRRPRHLFRVCG